MTLLGRGHARIERQTSGKDFFACDPIFVRDPTSGATPATSCEVEVVVAHDFLQIAPIVYFVKNAPIVAGKFFRDICGGSAPNCIC